MDNYSEESLNKAHRTATLVGLFMVFSVLIYAGVVEFLVRSKDPFAGFSPLPPDVYNMLRMILFILGIIDFALIPFLRKCRLTMQQGCGSLPADSQPNPAGKLFSVSIISMALSESIAIYGLVLFLLNGARVDFYVFFFLSLIAFTAFFPRYERWQVWTQEMRDTVGK